MSGQLLSPVEKITNITGMTAQANNVRTGETNFLTLTKYCEKPSPRQITERPDTKMTISPAVVLRGGKKEAGQTQ